MKLDLGFAFGRIMHALMHSTLRLCARLWLRTWDGVGVLQLSRTTNRVICLLDELPRFSATIISSPLRLFFYEAFQLELQGRVQDDGCQILMHLICGFAL